MAISQQLKAKAELERRRRGLDSADKFAPYRFDPIRYIVEKLGWHPWAGDRAAGHPGQVEVLEDYRRALLQLHDRYDYENDLRDADELHYWQPGERVRNCFRIEAGHTVGKCGIISDMITLSDGSRCTMGELVGKEFSLPTLVDGELIHTRARAELNRYEDVFKLTTDKGRSITRNAHHPVWCAHAVFSPGKRPIIHDGEWMPFAELRPGDLVAVAELFPEPLIPVDLPLNEVKLLAYLIGDGGTSGNSVRFSQVEGPQLREFIECAQSLDCVVDYIGQYDYIVYSKGRRYDRDNNVLNLTRRHGLQGKTAREKRIPPAIFQLSNSMLSIFLSRLYSTDGWATARKDGGVEIGYCSSSYELIRDLQELLLRFGVHANLFYKQNVDSWSLTINNKLDAHHFAGCIGIYGKEKAIASVLDACAYRVLSHARTIGERPLRPRWQHKNAVPGTRWEKVASVEYVGKDWTVAIEVPNYDTYLTEFWEHNTKLASGIFSHFFDCFEPGITYSFAPSAEQINDLLWKEIRTDRRAHRLPGRVLEIPELKHKSNHFAKGRAANNANDTGSERVQGQHERYLMFILDEAEGVSDFVYDAVESMASGGIAIVLMLANPRTRNSKFYRYRLRPNVENYRISCIYHPNVLADREIVPNAVRRDYVENMLVDNTDIVTEHSEDDHTFELPWRPGVIYKPNAEYMFRVMGVAPANIADNTFVPLGRFEAACKREAVEQDPHKARIGVDVARYGLDSGTIYVRWNGRIWRHAQLSGQNTNPYRRAIKALCSDLVKRGVTDLQIRVDGGGGYASGIIDPLSIDSDFRSQFERISFHEVLNNGEPFDPKSYEDLVTEMYAHTGESLKSWAIVNPPPLLEGDLTERRYGFANKAGYDVKRLESKDDFRKRINRSPDDGDGFVLAAAPDFIFRGVPIPFVQGRAKVNLRGKG